MLRRGAVYLVDFGRRYQSNIGKVRPAVILSSQGYLDIVDQLQYRSVLVVPLTTRCLESPANLLRSRITPRDRLQKESEAIINWSCSVDLENIDLETGALTTLLSSELRELEEKYALYCGIDSVGEK
jgi:mRNA interferase MazF